jgi:hypothetical protein
VSDQPLLVRDDSRLAITFSPAAVELKEEAIASCSLIVAVNSPGSQELAVDAQKSCRRLIKLVEDSRKSAKAPVIDYGRAIDDAAKKFVAEITAEEMRIAKLVGDYQQAELAKHRSAEALRVKELTDMERAREEKLSTVNTLEERERVHEEFSQLTQAMQAPSVAPARVDGQKVQEVWCFEVVNPHLLANSHPQLVKIEPRRFEINEALKSGMTIQGIRAWKEVKASVRLERESKAIAA